MPKRDSPFGPLGTFPHGRLNPEDEGALQIGVTHDEKGTVIIDFGIPVNWVGLPPDQAIEFAKTIMKHAGGQED